MSALPILSELYDMGIRVQLKGSELALSAPQGVLTERLVSRLRKEKPALLRSLSELRKKAGEDWQEIADDPDKLKVFTELLMIVEMREKGVAPDHYTRETCCKRCGTVPIFEGCPSQVDGCPWCFNRIKRLPIPGVSE